MAKVLKTLIISVFVLVFSYTILVYGMDNSTLYSDYYSECYVIKTDGTLYKIPCVVRDEENTVLELEEMRPQKISEGVTDISFDCILQENGYLYRNTDDGFVKLSDEVKSVSSSSSAVLFIKNDNSLWGYGGNESGQLAQGEMDKTLGQQIQDDLKYKNETKCTPDFFETPIKIMNNVKSAYISNKCSVVLKEDGTVWTFGYSQGGGLLGIGGRWLVNNEPTKILSGIKEIFVRGTAGFAVDENNTLWRWGSNYTGYAGLSENDKLIPEKYIEDVKYAANMPGYNLIIKTDNSLWIFGETDSDNGDIGYASSESPVKLAENVVSVTGVANTDVFDEDRIFALKENGDLMLYGVPMVEDKEPYLIGRVMRNVRVSDSAYSDVAFTDISDKTEEMQKAITSLAKAGIISGTGENEFSPDKGITRAEIAALLLRITSQNDADGNGGFEDVTEDMWYYNTAGASKKYGIVQGFENNTFRGDEAVSKVQLVSLAARVLRNESNFAGEAVSQTEYADVPLWAAEDVALAEQTGLISAETDLSSPDEAMTRGEAAIILYRLYGKV